MPKILYTCDPERNTVCSKANCYLKGGECHGTFNAAFADPNVKIVTFVFDVEDEDLKLLSGIVGDGKKEK